MPTEETKAEIKVAVAAEVAKQDAAVPRPGFFVSLANINWTRYWVFLSTLLFFWGSMSFIVPLEYYRIINGILIALTSSLGYFIRATRWVSDRRTVPMPGEQV